MNPFEIHLQLIYDVLLQQFNMNFIFIMIEIERLFENEIK